MGLELERLRAEVEMWKVNLADARADACANADELEAVNQDNARLRELVRQYMNDPAEGVDIDAPPMQLRPELQPCGQPRPGHPQR